MANEILIPPWILPESPEECVLIDDVTASFRPAYGRGFVQRQSFGDPRWSFTRKYSAMRQVQLARLQAAINEARGAFKTIRTAPVTPLRGALDATFPELMLYGTFASGVTGWNSSGATLTVSDQILRLQNSGAASGYISNTSAMVVIANAFYAVRVECLPGIVSNFRIRAGSAAASNAYGELTSTSPGVLTLLASPTDVYLYVTLYCDTTTSADFVRYGFASVHRCGRANAAVSSGANSFVVKNLPNSITDFLMAGDYIELNGELKQLTASINTDGSGTGLAMFRPSLSKAMLLNDPVIVREPMGRFLFDSQPKFTMNFGLYADVELQLSEVYE